ncbi:hypothetical protein AVEN_159944-1 [Araneus ventricosus]|uniref:Uncharacterized protein n=1 Tax=Araneus ventricosus TaxID=182803 RepID=A0A4Y2P440_ARAVE|nr:hypothetical protein AVEN_159944-1 [Araneus ventricosus]
MVFAPVNSTKPNQSSEETSSDTDTDLTIASAPEASHTQKNRARSKSEKSQKLKQAKHGLSQKDLPAKLKKNLLTSIPSLWDSRIGV